MYWLSVCCVFCSFRTPFNHVKLPTPSHSFQLRLVSSHAFPRLLVSSLHRWLRSESMAEVRLKYLGTSASQRLRFLQNILSAAGFVGDTAPVVLGDSFDEATLFDAPRFPLVMRRFAVEACRNDILSVGCFHLFFPNTRDELGLLNDKQKQADARFDRHHVVDLDWSLEELLTLAAQRLV